MKKFLVVLMVLIGSSSLVGCLNRDTGEFDPEASLAFGGALIEAANPGYFANGAHGGWSFGGGHHGGGGGGHVSGGHHH